MPVTLSGWLIGVGALIGGLGIVIGIIDGGFLNVIDLVLLLALLAIAATIFFSASLASVPHLRLATLVVALIGFGVALDRIGFTRSRRRRAAGVPRHRGGRDGRHHPRARTRPAARSLALSRR